MIKAIIFDVGGVLIRTEDRRLRQQLEDRLGLARGESEEIVFNSEMGVKAQRGEVTDAELWQWVGQRFNLSTAGVQEFRAAFWGGDALDTGLAAFIRRLRPTYQTAVISNATDALRATLTKVYPIADAFDLIVVSAEEGIMKPDRRIYELTLARLGRQPAESIFIDDFAHNVTAARALGMQAIHFQPGINLTAELEKLGVMV